MTILILIQLLLAIIACNASDVDGLSPARSRAIIISLHYTLQLYCPQEIYDYWDTDPLEIMTISSPIKSDANRMSPLWRQAISIPYTPW